MRDALLAAIADEDDCAQVTAEQLAALAVLTVEGSSLNSIRSGDFAGLSGLRTLSIRDTGLRTVPPRAFLGLADLESLVLHGNDALEPPQDGGFAGMPNLTSLKITGPKSSDGTAQFLTLRPGMFADMPKLTELDLSGSGVGYVPAGAFAGLSGLQRLDLSWNGPVRELSPQAFSGLTALRYLNLSNVKGLARPDGGVGVTLPEGIFAGLVGLSDVDLDNPWGDDSNLPAGLFQGLPALRYVRLADANAHTLSGFPARAFAGLTAALDLLWVAGTTAPGGGERPVVDLQVGLQTLGTGRFRAVAPAGATFDIEVPLTVTGGSLAGGASSLTIRAGATGSDVLEATRSQDDPVTVDIGTLPAVPARRAGAASPFGIAWPNLGHAGYRLAKADGLPLTVLAEREAPEVRLELAVDVLPENGGSTTLTALLSEAGATATEELRFRVTVSGDPPASPGDAAADGELTIAAGAQSGAVTIATRNDTRYTGDRTVQVSAAETAGKARVPAAVELTIAEDEAAPEARLEVVPDRVDEGRAARVAAVLSGPAPGWPLTFAVAAAADDPANPVGFTWSGSALTVVAGAHRSSKVLSITTVHDPVYAPDRSLRVSASIDGLAGLTAPPARTLTVADADGLPVAELVVQPARIKEAGGQSRVSASLSHASAAAIMLTVSAVPAPPTERGHFTPDGGVLTIAARATGSAGSITFTAADDHEYRAWDREVALHTASGDAVITPGPAQFVIEDDDPIPPLPASVELLLNPARISELDGRSRISVRLSQALTERAAVSLAFEAVAPATAGSFAHDGAALTIAAGDTESTGAVTLTPVNDDAFARDRTIGVTARVSTPTGASTATGDLVIEEDDPRPVVTLKLTAHEIGENGGDAVVTAAIQPSVSRDTRIRLAVTPTDPARLDDDYTVDGEPLLVIESGQTSSSGTFGDPYTITAVNDLLLRDARTLTVTGKLEGDHLAWLRDPDPLTLTIADDDSETPATGVCDRAEEVRDSILAEIEKRESSRPLCSAVTAEQLAAIDGLTITASRAVMSLRPGDFAGLSNVRRVSIDSVWLEERGNTVVLHYSLQRLHPLVFTGLSSLRQLILTDSELVSVPEELLAPLKKLTTLSFRQTRLLRELPPGLLQHAPDLLQFSYTSGSIESLPAGFFRGRSALQNVDLGGNPLTSLPARVFANLPALHSVDIGGSSAAAPFSVLPDGAFEGLSGPLRNLALHDVSLEVSLRAAGPGRFRAVAPSGAPFDIVLPLTASNGSIEGGATTVTIPAGSVESAALTVTRTAGTTAAVTVDIGTLPDVPNGHEGYELAKSGVPLTVFAAAGAPAVELVLSHGSIPEQGGVASVTARLAAPATEEVRLLVAVAPRYPATHADFDASGGRTLSIAAGATRSSGSVTISAVDNDRYAGDRTLEVAAAVTGGSAAVPAALPLKITEDEEAPTVTLALSADTIRERGGSALVSARAGFGFGVRVTLTVTAAGEAERADDFTLSGSTLTFAAGATESTGTVRVTAVDNAWDAPDHVVSITAAPTTEFAGIELTAGAALRLTIADDEGTPAVTLRLSPRRIDEDGGEATLSAAIDPPSFAATTVRLSVEAVAPADVDDVQVPETLSIAAQAAESEEATITAVDDDVYTIDKTFYVHGDAANDHGVTDPARVELTVAESDPLPAVRLLLSETAIEEPGGSTMVSAELDLAVAGDLTLTVTAAAVAPAVAAEFTQSGQTLTIAAGDTASSGEVTVSGVDDRHYVGEKRVLVSATVDGSDDLAAPAPVTLTIGEDEDEPALSLAVSPELIREDEVAAVTATLEPAYRDQLTVTVTATPVEPATGDDYVLSPNVLTFAGGGTASLGEVTVTAVPDDLASPPTTVRLDAESTETLLVAAEPVTLTITDVQERPTVSLVLSAEEIAEADGVANVTAALDVGSVLATTLSVTVQAVAPALAGDFRQHGVELTVPAGQTASSGAVTVTAVPDDVDAADGTYTVGAVLTAGYAAAPADLTLTIADDDETPRVELLLDPAEIEEGAGSVTVTARLSGGRSGEVTTVAVEVEPDEAEGGYEVSDDVTLTIAARERESAGTVTVTPDDDEIYGPASRTLTVSGTASNVRGVTGPEARTFEVTEDEEAPTVTLALSAREIDEDGGTATVTAALSGALDREVVLEVAATAQTRRFAGQVEIGANDELTIAAGQTASSGIVTVTAVNDSIDAPDTVVTVSALVSGADLAAPAPVTLTVADDDDAPTVTLTRSPAEIEEGGVATVTADLSHPSSVGTVVRVTAHADAPQETDQSGSPLVILAGETASRRAVTVTAVDNPVHAPGLTVTVSGTASNARGVAGHPAPVTIAVKDDESEPGARLILNPQLVREGESSTVTARLSHPSGAVTLLEVGAVAGAGAVAGDFSLSEENTTLTIAAGAYRSTGTVTVTAEDDELFGWAREVTVSGTASNPYGVTDPDDRTLTIEEDDAAPAASLELSAEAIDEGGTAAVTLSIATAAKVALRYEVTAQPEDAADRDAETDYSLGELTVAVGQTESGGTLTVTAPDNETDEPDRVMAVTAEPGHGDLSVPAARTLTIRDDDAAPVVTLMLSRSEIRERGDDTETTVTATLDRPSSAVTTVRVSADPVAPAAPGDVQQTGGVLTVRPGATVSTGRIVIGAVDNDVDAPDRTVRITGTARNRHGVAGDPEARTLTIRDDDSAPSMRLELSPPRIGERGGVSEVTAWLSHRSSAVTTVQVTVSPVGPAAPAYYAAPAETVLTIPARAYRSVGSVRIDAVDDTTYGPPRRVAVVPSEARNVRGVVPPARRALTITEDESPPVVSLVLSEEEGDAGSVEVEEGSSVTVSVEATGAFDRETTYKLTLKALHPHYGNFSLGPGKFLTVAAGAVASTSSLYIRAVDDDIDAPDARAELSATVHGAAAGRDAAGAAQRNQAGQRPSAAALVLLRQGGRARSRAAARRAPGCCPAEDVSIAPVERADQGLLLGGSGGAGGER